MKKDDFIKLDRSILDHWIWNEKPFSKGQAWVDLLLLATFKDHKQPYKGKIVTMKRGDVNCSISYLAERWGWSRNKTRSYLRLLETDEMITIKATTHRTTITVENYDIRQSRRSTKSTTNETARGQQEDSKLTTTEECIKNGKKGEECIYDGLPSELVSSLHDFEDMRKRIKAPMTGRAEELLIKKLSDMSKNPDGSINTAKAVEILDQSVMNGWKSVYPLKQEKKHIDVMDIDF